jgi:hypothetical protein
LAATDGSAGLLEFTLKPDGANFALDGKLDGGFGLDEIMRKADGSILAQGEARIAASFNGTARSPLGLLAALSGTGTLKLEKPVFPQFSPEPFFASLADVKDASGLQSTFKLASSGPGTEFDGGQTDFEIKQGNAGFQALALNKGNVAVGLSAAHDLANDELHVDLSASKTDQPDLPAFKVSYQGPAGALSEKDDFGALSTKLGYGFIARDMAELDRVKQEQEKLNAEQAAQQQADAEKFAAYQAQRGELRLRLRELKVHAAQRDINAARYKATVDAAIAAGQAMIKAERQRLLRMLPVQPPLQ